MRALVEILLKVWAVVLMTSAFAVIASLFVFLFAPGAVRSAQALAFIPLLVRFVLGLAVYRFADRIAERIIAGREATLAVEPLHLARLAFALLGVYFAVVGLSALGAPIYGFLTKPAWDETSRLAYMGGRYTELAATAVLQIAAGVALFAGSSTIARRVTS